MKIENVSFILVVLSIVACIALVLVHGDLIDGPEVMALVARG